jgi:hypothetical protein
MKCFKLSERYHLFYALKTFRFCNIVIRNKSLLYWVEDVIHSNWITNWHELIAFYAGNPVLQWELFFKILTFEIVLAIDIFFRRTLLTFGESVNHNWAPHLHIAINATSTLVNFKVGTIQQLYVILTVNLEK